MSCSAQRNAGGEGGVCFGWAFFFLRVRRGTTCAYSFIPFLAGSGEPTRRGLTCSHSREDSPECLAPLGAGVIITTTPWGARAALKPKSRSSAGKVPNPRRPTGCPSAVSARRFLTCAKVEESPSQVASLQEAEFFGVGWGCKTFKAGKAWPIRAKSTGRKNNDFRK